MAPDAKVFGQSLSEGLLTSECGSSIRWTHRYLALSGYMRQEGAGSDEQVPRTPAPIALVSRKKDV